MLQTVSVYDKFFQKKELQVSHSINFEDCENVPVPCGFEIIPPDEMKNGWKENQYRWNPYCFWMEVCSIEPYANNRPYIRKLTLCSCGQHDIKNNDIYASHKEFLNEKGIE